MEIYLTRRVFFKIFFILPIFSFAMSKSKKDDESLWMVLEEVMQIIFPKSEYFDGAKELGCIEYLKEAIESGYIFDKDKEVIINGAKYINDKYNFLSLDKDSKKKVFKKFVTSDGRGWLVVVLKYTLEGAFCHPIYEGNKKKRGWEKINFKIGLPEPKKRYALGRV